MFPVSCYLMTLLSQIGPARSIFCYSCSSIVESGCTNLFKLFTTYNELQHRMRRDCSEFNSTACGTYLWVFKEPEIGTIAVDSDTSAKGDCYIQRGCAYHPLENYCAEVKMTVIDVVNLTSFNRKKHCKICNESYCNSMSMLDFFNGGNCNSVGFLSVALMVWSIFIPSSGNN